MSFSSQFDPNNNFLEQMLSSVPSFATSFPWADEQLEEQSASLLESKLSQHQISNGAAKAMMLHQQQLFLSRNLLADQNDVIDGSSFNSAKPEDDPFVNGGFTGSLWQTSNQPQHFHQSQDFGPPVNQPAVSGGSSGEGAAGQPRQRVRARRGQATDPHSIAERLRRERIAERMKALQELVPNGNKTDKASMLDEIIDYVKFLQLQVKVLSMSRLGGASGVAPLVAEMSSKGKSINGLETASSSNNNDGMIVTENQVAKMLEDDMGSAMQYLQGKGLCLMPISLASAISSATCNTRNPFNTTNNRVNGGEAGGSTSPSMSALTAQSTNNIGGGGGETSLKDVNLVPKP